MFDFKALFNAWRGAGLVNEMFKEFQEMMDDGGKMFKGVCDAMSGRDGAEAVRENLRGLDKEINRTQRDIRRKVVEHLTLNPASDVPACLVLMSIVKDAERLGDYAQDLYKAWQLAPEAVKLPKYAPMLAQLQDEVGKFMADTRQALATSDEKLANDVMDRERSVKALADAMLAEVTRDQMSPAEAVSLAVISRYLRRLAAHTANIASSVVNPVEWLDYKSKKPK